MFFDCSKMKAIPHGAKVMLAEPGVIASAKCGVQLLRSMASFIFREEEEEKAWSERSMGVSVIRADERRGRS